ncbi:S8 family serine peptidase [Streptomyces fructofermentans]|uniref:S8 family serine peptidase n=1 Tax=Streptomyces fructofermentans TaxID=152141 RepID=UPI0037A53E6D
MAESNALIGTPEAWEAGLTGKDVTVAVHDTGVEEGHPDLAGRVSATRSFVEGEEAADRNGHGTHVTSAVGGGAARWHRPGHAKSLTTTGSRGGPCRSPARAGTPGAGPRPCPATPGTCRPARVAAGLGRARTAAVP